jgi:hypothetical protein
MRALLCHCRAHLQARDELQRLIQQDPPRAALAPMIRIFTATHSPPYSYAHTHRAHCW